MATSLCNFLSEMQRNKATVMILLFTEVRNWNELSTQLQNNKSSKCVALKRRISQLTYHLPLKSNQNSFSKMNPFAPETCAMLFLKQNQRISIADSTDNQGKCFEY